VGDPVERRRRRLTAVRRVRPCAPAGLRRDGEDAARAVGGIEPAVPDRGRELDQRRVSGGPHPAERRPQANPRGDVQPLGVVAERRPDDRLLARRGRRDGCGRGGVVLDRGAAMILLVPMADDEVRGGATRDEEQHDDGGELLHAGTGASSTARAYAVVWKRPSRSRWAGRYSPSTYSRSIRPVLNRAPSCAIELRISS